MAFAGGIGADLNRTGTGLPEEALLFAESTTRFLVEVHPSKVKALEACLTGHAPLLHLGQTCKEPRLRIAGQNGEWIIWAALDQLKGAWQGPLKR
jgi:phosphoribosylformylglycinamidine synthase